MPLILACGKQRQADLCEFEANLVYRASSRTGSEVIERETLSRGKKILFCLDVGLRKSRLVMVHADC